MFDALTLAAMQPEGAVASEAVRGEIKSLVREGAKSTGREAVEAATESLGKAEIRGLKGAGALSPAAMQHLARWWTVRAAGGTYRVLKQARSALPRLTLVEVADVSRPLFARAGMKLGTWGPARFWKDGLEVVRRIPPNRGLKYLTAQVVAAEVGFIGVKKMEEHLASRRPSRSHSQSK
jgi:hypothetical protein